ncbi:MAG: FecR family protein [Proteobacteria bacterium]|nr:FecR family protein [Pseudomonadota bacterium]
MNTQLLVNYLKFLSKRLPPCLAVMVLLWPMFSSAEEPEERDTASAMGHLQQVGEVSLVLGRASLQRGKGARLPIEIGSAIRVADRILTEANGHVHIRFVDNALVSVRPDSSLEIVSYDFNVRQPALSSVKFNLEGGVTRSISGSAAKAARERFRLNTPIAAIGVRGTDFVVSATETTVRALVNEGVIVLAPFSSECTAEAFGPCTVNAVELTDSTLQLIEFDENTPAPRLLPAPHERDPNSMRDEVQLAIANSEDDGEDKTVSNEVYLEGVTTTRVTAEAASVKTPTRIPVVAPAPAIEIIPDFTPPAPVATQDLTGRQLVWGRWANGQGDLERITLSYAEARTGREVSIGNSDYLLFRPDLGSKNVDAGLGVVSFGLSSAQAFYHSGSGVVAMQVRDGSLDIDFDTNKFATALFLNHDLTGLVDFNASGSLFDGGYFHSRTDGQRIAGAVSLDGKEAGYFFEKQLQDGGIQGITLWDSQ